MTDLLARRVARFNGIPHAAFVELPAEERIEMEAFYQIEMMTPKARTAAIEAARADRQREIEAALRDRLRRQHG